MKNRLKVMVLGSFFAAAQSMQLFSMAALPHIDSPILNRKGISPNNSKVFGLGILPIAAIFATYMLANNKNFAYVAAATAGLCSLGTVVLHRFSLGKVLEQQRLIAAERLGEQQRAQVEQARLEQIIARAEQGRAQERAQEQQEALTYREQAKKTIKDTSERANERVKRVEEALQRQTQETAQKLAEQKHLQDQEIARLVAEKREVEEQVARAVKQVRQGQEIIDRSRRIFGIPAFDQWRDTCLKLPSMCTEGNKSLIIEDLNRIIVAREEERQLAETEKYVNFKRICPTAIQFPLQSLMWFMEHFTQQFAQSKQKTDLWLTPFSEERPFYIERAAATQNETVYAHADLHGDVRSLMKFLQHLQSAGVIDSNWRVVQGNRIVFLGDYIDRGFYGIEVLYTLMILKFYNPESVTLIRGNHESYNTYMAENIGEMRGKIEKSGIIFDVFSTQLNNYFETLPVAFYLKKPGDRYILFTHGAHNHEHETLDTFLLSPELADKKFDSVNYVQNTYNTKDINGYSWSDYNQDPFYPDTQLSGRGVGHTYSQCKTIEWMNGHTVDTIIHGHSHRDENLCEGRVIGLRVSPEITTVIDCHTSCPDVFAKINTLATPAGAIELFDI